MGTYSNVGKTSAITVKGNPDSFLSLIINHGLLAKIKQAIMCTCLGTNHGSPDLYCPICKGDGFLYAYQRNFFVADENSPINLENTKELIPFWTPVLSVVKVQNVTSEIQGGIDEIAVSSVTSNKITVSQNLVPYMQRRVTYTFDGWTYVPSEKLVVDADHGIMYANGTIFDAGYQSSNPLNAFADITQIVRIWNIDTGVEIGVYTFEGNTIYTDETIVPDKMYAEYYYSDLTQVIATDVATRDQNEQWTHMLASGETRVALYPFIDISKGDIITLSAVILWKTELINHLDGNLDRLNEMEIAQLNNVILDQSGNKYYINTDYILQGRNIKWLTDNKPAKNAILSVRYAFKPSFVVFDDNPQPNNLENRLYPRLCMVKTWTKTAKDDVIRLLS